MMQIPKVYEVKSIAHDTHDVFTIALKSKEGVEEHPFRPGQFNMLYPFGFGEAPISISNNPKDVRMIYHTIRAVGSVTKRLQRLQPGDEIGVRGPFGTHWPEPKKGSDVLVIAGGIGFAAVRSILYDLASRSRDYRKITLLYGTRTVDDILYQKEMQDWKAQGIDVQVTLDYADVHWKGKVGVVTGLIRRCIADPANTIVMICGPEIMLNFALHELLGAQVEQENIYISMERNMQCAVGFCGHCQFGPYFVCKDGPVFSYPQIRNFLTIKEL